MSATPEAATADLATVRLNRYVLTPGRYVGTVTQFAGEPTGLRDTPATLMKDLYAIFD